MKFFGDFSQNRQFAYFKPCQSFRLYGMFVHSARQLLCVSHICQCAMPTFHVEKQLTFAHLHMSWSSGGIGTMS